MKLDIFLDKMNRAGDAMCITSVRCLKSKNIMYVRLS